jgi:acetyltransferase
MRLDEVRHAVLDTIASIAPETDIGALRPEQPLRQQIDLDSIDWMNVVVELCARLAVDIPDSEYGKLATLESIVTYLAARRSGCARAQPPVAAAGAVELPHTRHVINGVPVSVRPMRVSDAQLETAFVQRLSSESRYDRFMVTVHELPESKLRYLTDVDQVRHVALIATIERDGHEVMIGVVRYAVDPTGSGCEFAVAVDDAWQGSGLAGILMHALIDVARRRGLTRMEGTVLAINSRMLRFTRQLGFRQERDPADRDTVRVVRAL